MVVVDLAEMQFPEQSLVDYRADQGEVGAVAALEADADLDAAFADRLAHRRHVLVREGDRLFDDQVLAGARRGDRLLRVEGVGGADVDDVDVAVGQHLVEAGVRLQRGAELRCQVGLVVFPAGADRGDAAPLHRLEGFYVGAGNPAKSHDADVEVAHDSLLVRCDVCKPLEGATAEAAAPGLQSGPVLRKIDGGRKAAANAKG